MNQTVYNIFKGFPVVGPIVQAAFIGSRVKSLVKKAESMKLDDATKEKKGEELDEALSDVANDMYEESVTPLVVQEGIPEAIEKPIREKAVEEIVGVLRKKFIK